MPQFLNILSDSTFSEKMDAQNTLLAAIAGNGGGLVPKSFADVQSIVRLGLAPTVFSVGDQFVCMRGEEQLVWDIVAFDRDKPLDPARTHSMTLQLHGIISETYSCLYAPYYLKKSVPAGTYWLYDAESGKTVHFTFSTAVPARTRLHYINGQIVLNTSRGVSFSPLSYRTAEGEEGTALTSLTDLVDINPNPELRHGNNAWENSHAYRWLNLPPEESYNDYWRATNKYELFFYTRTDGFMQGMDTDFLQVLSPVAQDKNDNKTFFFLPTQADIYGESGDAYDYYRAFSALPSPGEGADPIRCKLSEDYSEKWYTSSKSPGSATKLQVVLEDGSIASVDSHWNSLSQATPGLCPACCIA